jgi:hypothetical protein
MIQWYWLVTNRFEIQMSSSEKALAVSSRARVERICDQKENIALRERDSAASPVLAATSLSLRAASLPMSRQKIVSAENAFLASPEGKWRTR